MAGPATGELKQYLDVKQPVGSQDSSGQHNPAHESVKNCWGEITPVGGQEGNMDGTVEAIQTYRIRLRYDPDFATLDESWQIEHVDSSRTFEPISAFKVDEWNEWIEITAKELKT